MNLKSKLYLYIYKIDKTTMKMDAFIHHCFDSFE